MFEGISEIQEQIKLRVNQMKGELKNQESETETIDNAGNINVKIDGNQFIKELKINSELLKDIHPNNLILLEELIKNGINKGIEKSKEEKQKRILNLMGGFNIPGLSGLI